MAGVYMVRERGFISLKQLQEARSTAQQAERQLDGTNDLLHPQKTITIAQAAMFNTLVRRAGLNGQGLTTGELMTLQTREYEQLKQASQTGNMYEALRSRGRLAAVTTALRIASRR